MNIFVTGGAGYIGSVTVKRLLDQGHRVVVFDVLENGHAAAVDLRAQFIEGDLRSREMIQKALSAGEIEAVIHFAGYIESGESMQDPLRFFENNFSAGLNLLSVLKEREIKNFIFSSTAGIYGTGQPPFTEESPVNTTSDYSRSKYFFEEALRSASRAYGFRVVVLRYFNAAGALEDGSLGEDHNPETHLIPLIVKAALAIGPEFNLWGTDYPTPDGTAVRDYIHVEDLARAHLLSLNKFSGGKGFFEIYNVGTGRGYSNQEIIDMVKKVSGRDFKVIKKPRRAGDWDVSYAVSRKIQKEFNWQPRFGLKEIVESAYLWHKRNPYGFTQEQTVRP